MTTPKNRSTPSRRSAAASAAPTPTRAHPAKRAGSHDVVAALVAEHRHAARLLDVLEQQLHAVARGRPLDREAVLGVMSYMTEYPDAYHHPREDAMFVRLVKRDRGLKKQIAAIELAHRTIGAAGQALLAALQRQPSGGADARDLAPRIGDYVGAMREHMAIEERDLFPRARQLLDEEDLAAIERDFRRVTDPVFEASVRDAYAAYPALVRLLAEQPAVRQLLDVLDSAYESAMTIGEALSGGAAARSAGAGAARPETPASAVSRTLRDGVDRRAS